MVFAVGRGGTEMISFVELQSSRLQLCIFHCNVFRLRKLEKIRKWKLTGQRAFGWAGPWKGPRWHVLWVMDHGWRIIERKWILSWQNIWSTNASFQRISCRRRESERKKKPSVAECRFSPNWKRLINHGRCMLKNTMRQLRHVSFKDWHALRFTTTQKTISFKDFPSYKKSRIFPCRNISYPNGRRKASLPGQRGWETASWSRPERRKRTPVDGWHPIGNLVMESCGRGIPKNLSWSWWALNFSVGEVFGKTLLFL